MASLEFFTTQLYRKRILNPNSLLFREIEKECSGVHAQDRAGQIWSKLNYPFGYTSYGSVNRLFFWSSNFASLKEKIDKVVLEYGKSIGHSKLGKEIEMTDLWLNVMKKGSHHSWHTHPKSVISGTFYVQIPVNAPGLQIEDPRFGYMMNAPVGKKSKSHPNVRASAGEVILFESWLRHQVPLVTKNLKRVSLSFNYGWKVR